MTAVLERDCRARDLDWATLRAVTSDIVHSNARWIGPPPPEGNTFTGIWGIRTRRVAYAGGHYEEFTDFPLAGVTSVAELAAYSWPDAAHYDYAALRRETLAVIGDRHRALQVLAGHPFEIYCWLTGLEEALINVLTAPEIVTAALAHIGGFFEQRLRRTLAEIGDLVDVVFLADDLGSQQGLLLSRPHYRALLQPVHARLTAAVRELAPHAWCMMHSDGAVYDILPDLLDAGVQVMEAVQTDAAGMAPERLKQTYAGRLAFHGAISVQALLPRADAATVEEECRRLVAVLGAGGGYIAAPSHAIQVGTPPENVFAMLRGVLGPNDYAEALAAARLPR
jgi:uroporphyrinogen decarboxylase